VIAAAAERGEPIPESLTPPPIGAVEQPFWDGFAALCAARPLSAPSPLALSEILAWCDLTGIKDPVSRRELHDVIRALDQAWLGGVAVD
jgi:hypothetical protein